MCTRSVVCLPCTPSCLLPPLIPHYLLPIPTPPITASGHEKFYRCELADLVWRWFMCVYACVRTHACECVHAGRPWDLSVSHCVKQGCWQSYTLPSSTPSPSSLTYTHTLYPHSSLPHMYVHTIMCTVKESWYSGPNTSLNIANYLLTILSERQSWPKKSNFAVWHRIECTMHVCHICLEAMPVYLTCCPCSAF